MNANVLIADTHINNCKSLIKPNAALDDGPSITPSEGQYFLWRSYEDFLARCERIQADCTVIHLLGDAVDGDVKNRSKQILTRNISTIRKWAADILEPLVHISDGLIVYRGTEAHGGQSGELEEDLADDLDAIVEPSTGAHSWYANLFTSDGVRMDLQHHPPGNGGRRLNTSQSVVDNLACDTMLNYTNNYREPPDVVIRAHIHRYRDSRDAFRVRAITLPCWCLDSAYLYRFGKSPVEPPDIGAGILWCSAGHYEFEPFRYHPTPTPFYSLAELKNGHHR